MAATEYDVAVVGSGFAGSLLAMIARRQGRSTVLIEKDLHPRFAIGESSTPLSNLLLEELASRYDLQGILPLTQWGTWRKSFPDLDCGLKRGFTFYHHQFGLPAATDPDRQDQLLVAASTNEATADTHWYRADVDTHFVRQAEATGVAYYDQVHLTQAVESDDAVTLYGRRHKEPFEITARFVVDATGPRGFLHRAFGLPELPLPGFPKTQALYTHFTGVRRLEEILGRGCVDSPYPVDDAAVHHIFDGGWIWVLRFRSGITSAGVAALDSRANEWELNEGSRAWERLLRRLPTVRDQFAAAAAVRPFVHVPRLCFRSGIVAGERWALLPSAAGFVDPLLSTGFPLTLLGVARLAEIWESHWGSNRIGGELARYGAQTTSELLAAAQLIGSLYCSVDDFPRFASLSMLYFATASFAEAARRLARPELAQSFLLHDHPALKDHWEPLLSRAGKRGWDEEVLRAVEPFNIGGFGDPNRRNWYPVDAEDLLRGASKLGATAEEIQRWLL